MFCATPKFWSSGEGFPTAKPGAAVTGQSGNPEKDRSRHLATQGASSRMTDLVNCSAFADSLDLTATAGAGFAGFIFDAIQSAIDIGVARYDLNVLARLRERN